MQQSKYLIGHRIKFPAYCFDSHTKKTIRFEPTAVIYQVDFSDRFSKFYYWCNNHRGKVQTRAEIQAWLEADAPSFVWENNVIELVN